MQGGELTFYVSKDKAVRRASGSAPGRVGENAGQVQGERRAKPQSVRPLLSRQINFTLNRQHRTWPLTFAWRGDTLVTTCKEATYMTARAVAERATGFCWDIPADGAVYQPKGTFAFVSAEAMRHLHDTGWFEYDGITWRNVGDSSGGADHVRADIDQTEMWIEYCEPLRLYLVTRMQHNPLGIDWHTTE